MESILSAASTKRVKKEILSSSFPSALSLSLVLSFSLTHTNACSRTITNGKIMDYEGTGHSLPLAAALSPPACMYKSSDQGESDC